MAEEITANYGNMNVQNCFIFPVRLRRDAHQPVMDTFHIIHEITSIQAWEVSECDNFTSGVFWDVAPCGSCKNRRFGET
jgi:hypothetical protein